MSCYRRNSNAYRKSAHPSSPIAEIPELTGEGHVISACVGMTSEADGAAALGHKFEVLPELPGQRVEIYNKARHVGPYVVTEKYALRTGILHNMKFREGAEIFHVLPGVQRIKIVLIVQPHLVVGQCFASAVLQLVPVGRKFKRRGILRKHSRCVVVVVAWNDYSVLLPEQRQAFVGIAQSLVFVIGNTESGDITQTDQPVVSCFFDPAHHFPEAFYILVDVRYNCNTHLPQVRINAEFT